MRRRGQERVLLTGATGYLGRRLAEKLLDEKFNVHFLVRPTSDKKRLYSLPGEPVLHEHDGTMQGMIRLFRAAEPDTVIHLAGLTSADHRAEDIDPLIQSNVLLGTQLLEASREFGTQRFINTATYWQHFRQKPYDPVSLYAATKQAFEDILRFYAETLPLRTVTLALYDIYGPDDPRPKLLQQLQECHKSGQLLKLSPGKQFVDFVHVDDAASAYLHALRLLSERASEVHGRTYAVRTGRPVTVREFAALYQRLTQSDLPIEWGGLPYHPRAMMAPWDGEILPGWKPMIALEDGLKSILRTSTAHRPLPHG